jgi:V/A-type H+-transporting ATPase subunit I
MFRSQVMNKVELVVPRQDVVPVTEALAASGIFHLAPQEHTDIVPADYRDGDNWHEQAALFASLEQRILLVMEALCVDEGEPPPEAHHIVEPETAMAEVEQLEQEARAPLKELEEEHLRLNQLRRTIAQLELVANLDVELDTLHNLRYLFATLGNIPAPNLERLRSSLEHVPSKLIELKRDDHLATVVLFGAKRDAEVLDRAARSAYLNPISLPETYQGTPAEIIESLQADVERTNTRINECHLVIDRLHETRVRRLQRLLWQVRASRTLVETIAQYGRLRFTYLVAGWVPASRLSELQRSIERASGDVQFESTTPGREHADAIPTAMDSPPLLKAFQSLVSNYGQPAYGELNPTLILALTFPLVFGLMFGDVGHGFLLTLLGMLLVSGVVRQLRKAASAGFPLIACGITSMLFGVLYGSFFGDEELLKEWLHGENWMLQPTHNIMDTLLVAVAVGIGLLSLGMILSMVNDLLARRWGHLFFGHYGLAGLLFYWSMVGLGASVMASDLGLPATPLAVTVIVSGLAVVFGHLLAHLVEGHRPLVEDSAFTYLMRAAFEFFELLIGLLSNTLSYIRMGAFAVAHGALSMVVAIIAETISPGKGVLFWVVYVLGTLFVIGFEGMIVGIQTLRLEYYEFFSKFFSGSGVRYRPLELTHKERAQQ